MKISIYQILFLLACIPLNGFSQAEQSDKYWRQAEKLSLEGKYAQSLRYYKKAYQLVNKTDPVRSANLCNDMSSAYYADGQYTASIVFCHQGLRHVQGKSSIPDSIFFKLYSSLGTMHNALRQRDSADFYFQWADAILDRSPSVEKDIPIYVLHHYLHQGRAFWALHRYNQSISYFTKANRLSENYKLADELDYIQTSLAEAYDLLGEHRNALRYRLLSLKRSFVDLRRQQGLYSGVAYTYKKLGLHDSSLIWYEKSWNQHILQSQNTEYFRKEHVRLFFLIGSCYRQRGNLGYAEKCLRKAIEFSKFAPIDKWVRANILIELGKIAQSRAQISRAEAYYTEAFKTVSLTSSGVIQPIDLLHPQTALLALFLRASLQVEKYRRSNNPSDLLVAYQSFRELIKLKRQAFYEAAQDTEERQFISDESQEIFRQAIPVGYEMYTKSQDPIVRQEVFNWFEDANASYLFEAIRDKNILRKNLPPEILAREEILIQKRAILTASSGHPSVHLQRQIDQLRLDWYKHQQATRKLATSNPGTFHTPINLDHLQKKIDGQSVFLSYKWFDSELYIFLVTREKILLVECPVNKELFLSFLSKLKKEFTNNPGLGNYTGAESAIGCYKILIEPIKKWMFGKTRLIVARDWQFNFLPLELLETGQKSDDYLALNYAISYTYSASLFWQHPSLTGFLPKPNSSMVIAPFVKQQIFRDGWKSISSLEELNAIGGESLWGEKATKQQFLKTGVGHHLLHLATHAEAQDENPNDSYIQFYPGTNSRLYLNEIYTLPLHSTRLMILSACSAGKGRNIRGEGNISLAHAIAQAGCPSLVTTIWEANDDVIGYLSVRLHAHLKAGQPIDRAIQMARFDFFADNNFKKFTHPYYWANFTLIGNNDSVYAKPVSYSFSSPVIVGAVIIILVFIVVLGLVSMKHNRKMV